MKKIMLALSALACCAYSSDAQISKGGIPQSLKAQTSYDNVPVAAYTAPDWQAQLQAEKESTNAAKPFVVALYSAADFGFPRSGQLVQLENGRRIWRGQISIAEAPAIGLLYDKFNLPKGVSLFLSNKNKQQVLGAFDADNNDASGTFVTDAIQGSVVHVELNIEPQVNLNDIELHIDRAAVFHRAIEHLRFYAGEGIPLQDQYDSMYNGNSSTCMINAICPQGAAYSNSRKATVQLLFFGGQGVGSCSATLLNNTGNSPANCKPYILTASHCEVTNSVSNATLNQTIVRFNFEHSACTGSAAPSAQSMTGVDFVARSDYGSFATKGDFMLLALRAPIPASYGAILSGWNNNPSIPDTVAEPKKFIGFHHPAGDNKKLSYGHAISIVGSAEMPDISWSVEWEAGYHAGGSSGSGLFDGDGYLIGDLSAGLYSNPDDTACNRNVAGQHAMSNDVAFYSRFSKAWEYTEEGTAANRRLKPWLDPAGTNAVTINPVTASCTGIGTTSLHKTDDDLADNIQIFPNPSSDGIVSVRYNLGSSQELSVAVADLTGQIVFTTKLGKVQSGTGQLNLGALASGMYLVKISTATGFTSKKLVIQK